MCVTEEKQIEEMAKDMCDCCRATSIDSIYPCQDSVCEPVRKHAEALYNINYRRQDKPNSCGHENGCVGEWITKILISTSKRGRMIKYSTYKCSVCGSWNGRHTNKFCPNCGAKMKGV